MYIVYILDDILSTVDAEVGRQIFADCILTSLIARNIVFVMATHQLQYLPYADFNNCLSIE